jgi:hypothetical protein
VRQATERGGARGGIDTATPNVARIDDFLLGGKDNFAAGREAARELISLIPDAAAIAGDNRSFLGRAVRCMATECGIRQFLDLGGGLPTQANVHELAQGVAPEAHVVYVDHDPVVASHGRALLASGDRVAVVLADLREAAAVLEHPEVRALLDLSRPVAVLCTSTLHFIPDEDAPTGSSPGTGTAWRRAVTWSSPTAPTSRKKTPTVTSPARPASTAVRRLSCTPGRCRRSCGSSTASSSSSPAWSGCPNGVPNPARSGWAA